MKSNLKAVMKFRLLSAINVSGDETKMWLDKVMAKDWLTGLNPVIPATSMKGWLREAAERALRGLNIKVCDSSITQIPCGTCIICHLFGHPRSRSSLRFHDTVMNNSTTDLRMGVALSRNRKTSYENLLYSTEVSWHDSITTFVTGVFSNEKEAHKAATVLYVAAKTSVALGSSRSRGLGWVEVDGLEFYINGQPLDENILKDVLNGFVTNSQR